MPILLYMKVMENKKQQHTQNHHPSAKPEPKSFSPRPISREDYMCYLVEHDELLKSFFEKLRSWLDAECDKKDILYTVQEISEKYDHEQELLKELREQIEKSGVKVSSEKQSKEHYAPVLTLEGRGFGNVGKYGYTSSRTYDVAFNGIEVTEEMLTNPEATESYQKDYDYWQENNGDIESKISKIQSELTKQKNALKWKVWKKRDISTKIENLSFQLSIYDSLSQEGEKKKKNAEIFSALTGEQKKAILGYMQQIKKCETIGDDLKAHINESISRSHPTRQRKMELLQPVLREAMARGELTPQTSAAVNEKFMAADLTRTQYTKSLNYGPYPNQELISMYFEQFIEPSLQQQMEMESDKKR